MRDDLSIFYYAIKKDFRRNKAVGVEIKCPIANQQS